MALVSLIEEALQVWDSADEGDEVEPGTEEGVDPVGAPE
jgi:hypothetical protein